MLKHFRRNTGSALVEFMLVAPFLMLVLISSAELGRIAYGAIEVADAAHAGAVFGSTNTQTAFGGPSGSPTAPIEQAAIDDAGNISSLTFPTAPTQACVCETTYASSTTPPTFNPTSGTTSCSSTTITGCTTASSTETQTVIQYVVVTTQAKIATMFQYPGIPKTFTVSGYSEMRVLQN